MLMVMLKQAIIVTSLDHLQALHRDYNVKVKLNHKILVIFYNLKNFDSHHIMQDLGKLGLTQLLYQMD